MYKRLLRRVQRVRAEQVELAMYNVSDARRHLSRLVDRVLDGDEIVIARAGRPVVKLVRYERRELTRPGLIRAEVVIDAREQPPPLGAATPTRSSTAVSRTRRARPG